MKTKLFLYSIAFSLSVFLTVSSCSKLDESGNINSYTLDLSTNYDYNLVNNDLGKLGRVLFYDQALSVNNSVSCGSCHKQSVAFADNVRFSKGFERKDTERNTPPIQNLGLSIATFNGTSGQALFWDGRERVLGDMVMQPMFNHVEMGMRSPTEVVNRVKEKQYYSQLFTHAFGDDNVTIDRISKAISGFVTSISSTDSPFDAGMVGAAQSLGAAEERGINLFFTKYNCGSCHQLFSSSGYSVSQDGDELINIGLESTYTDKGAGAITKKASDDGKFKIPNLRNVALTAPYMHDGRFTTLEEVVDHYNSGIKQHPNLDARLLENGAPMVMNITEQEKKDIIAFLHTLTDNTLTTDPKFSNPFKSR